MNDLNQAGGVSRNKFAIVYGGAALFIGGVHFLISLLLTIFWNMIFSWLYSLGAHWVGIFNLSSHICFGLLEIAVLALGVAALLQKHRAAAVMAVCGFVLAFLAPRLCLMINILVQLLPSIF